MDFITQSPLSNNFDSILVVVDRFSKMTIFIPAYETIAALDLPQICISHVFSKHGLPASIVSDRGSLFVSSSWTNLCQQLKISRNLSASFHSETDGQTERVNQIIEQYLWIYPTRPTKKLLLRWLEPFEFLKKVRSHAYHLKLPLQWRSVHPLFHVSLLEPVKQSIIQNQNELPPPPILVEEQEEWEVAQALALKLKRGKLWYLVEWKVFIEDPERTTWEPASNLTSSPDPVKDFHSFYPENTGPNTSRVLSHGAWWGLGFMEVSSSPGMNL
ncbi:hypothetical protein O181_024883 [Austropuccinia psidii MF-1]|uniref:Integrase catalytic domain-containing protein n=1 Tax=Austropuccinia psidii MF-1 TaxID=1389203 RepID=A0A9Q3GYL4_9BASI|nr:hypothetical protein [Austropuccinia psidii MF-1]